MSVYTFSRLITGVTTAQLLLQLKAPSTSPIDILRAWIDGNVTDDEKLEAALSEVTTAATVTAAVAAELRNHTFDGPDSIVALGTAATGYDASVAPTSVKVIRMRPSLILGYNWHATPEERLIIPKDQIVGLETYNTITSQDLIASITYRQLS